MLHAGDLAGVGRFMQASHDGDRIVRFAPDGTRRRHVVRIGDAALDKLARADAEPAGQSGRYSCSTEAIDRLVDLACGVEGVVGAQLAGAGLGGCMMILVRADAVELLLKHLRRFFYATAGIAFGAHVCSPVAGAGLLEA